VPDKEKRDYTPYQQRVIRRYYENQESSRKDALLDVVSKIWLATNDAKRASLWKRAEELLLALGVGPKVVEHVVAGRKVEALAGLAAKVDDGKAPGPRKPGT
jgi:hypothetical protein